VRIPRRYDYITAQSKTEAAVASAFAKPDVPDVNTPIRREFVARGVEPFDNPPESAENGWMQFFRHCVLQLIRTPASGLTITA
jgi:hypothetical protein